MTKGNSLPLKSTLNNISSSKNIVNDIETRKGSKNSRTCGKVRQKSGKLCGKACGKLETGQARISHADQMADWLVDKLKAPYCRQYFCKCAYHLTYEQIASALVSATMPTVKSPIKYFNAVTKRLMIKQVS